MTDDCRLPTADRGLMTVDCRVLRPDDGVRAILGFCEHLRQIHADDAEAENRTAPETPQRNDEGRIPGHADAAEQHAPDQNERRHRRGHDDEAAEIEDVYERPIAE